MALKTGTIKQKVFIKASPEEVYEAFVNPKKHSAFTGSKATGNAKVGSKITAWDGYISGKNLKLVKAKSIVQEWKTTEWPKDYSYSRLELSLKKKGNGTELTMVHSKVPQSQVRMYKQGWYDAYWDPLKEYFAKPSKKQSKR